MMQAHVLRRAARVAPVGGAAPHTPRSIFTKMKQRVCA